MHVRLYSTADCGLCDAFHYELLDLQADIGFPYEKCHLTPNDPLFAEYAGRFPVVHIERADGEVVRLASPVSQPELRSQIRLAAALSAGAQVD